MTEVGFQSLRVITLNTWNGQGDLEKRLPLMIEGLTALTPDLVLLQEVFHELPHGMHVGKVLADRLGLGFDHFVPFRRKVRDCGGTAVECSSGLGLLSRFPIQDAQAILLPLDADDGERLGQMVLLDVGGVPIRAVNLHLTFLPGREDLRRDQMAAALASIPDDGVATILGGDLNATKDAPLFDLLDGFRWLVYTGSVPTSSLNPVDGAAPPLGIIDHLMLRDGGAGFSMTSRFALDQPDPTSDCFASDHKALFVKIAGSPMPA